MVVAKIVTGVVASDVLLGLAGCVATRGSLTNAVDKLEYTANTTGD